MKIAIIHQKYTKGGGMESYLMDLLHGFLAQGDRVTIYVYKQDRTIPAQSHLDIRCTSLSFLPRRWRRYFFWSKLNTVFNRTDFDLSISLTRTACQDISICGGTHLGMLHQVRNRHLLNRLFHDKIENNFEKYMLRKVPRIIAHSKIIADELHRHYAVPLKKISVLYPPINREKFKPISQDVIQKARDQYSINSRRINFLSPSVGHHCKGLTQLLSAFSSLSDHYQLYLAGSRPRQQLPANVHFVGYVNNLAPLYAAVNYTILPSNYEAFGLVVAESLACLTPVVITAQVGAAELVTKKEAVILPDNQPKTLIQVIKQLPFSMPIEPSFVIRHQLTIDQHINAIKKIKFGSIDAAT
jgi:glycosyltransferase involved in cell wall biosynthesis